MRRQGLFEGCNPPSRKTTYAVSRSYSRRSALLPGRRCLRLQAWENEFSANSHARVASPVAKIRKRTRIPATIGERTQMAGRQGISGHWHIDVVDHPSGVGDSVVRECNKRPQLSTTRHYGAAKAFTSNPLRTPLCHKLQQPAEFGLGVRGSLIRT